MIILGKYLLVPGLGDIKVKYTKHVFLQFERGPLVSWLYFTVVSPIALALDTVVGRILIPEF